MGCPRIRLCLPSGGRWVCSADFQSAVSPTCSRQGVGSVTRAGSSQRLAEYNSAIQRGAAKPQPTSPSPPSDGGEGWGEEEPPLSSVLSPLLRRGEGKKTSARRFERILTEYNSALRWALNTHEDATPALLPKALLSPGPVAINSPCHPPNLFAPASSLISRSLE